MIILFLVGLIASIVALVMWGGNQFGDMNPETIMRVTIPAVCLCVLGVEITFGGFFIGILQIKHK